MSARSSTIPTPALVLVAAILWQVPAAAQDLQRVEIGRQWILHFGCSGCHELANPALNGLGKPGPDLRRIAAKTSASWTLAWLMDPRGLQPTTSMPHFFEEDSRSEARAIVAYLGKHSEAVDYPPAPAGDAVRGEELFRSVGCTGCHLRDREAKRSDFSDPYRLHGPNLAGLGAKVGAGWLYAWLRDPRRYDPETPMPDLRLTDREAADLTAYLLADGAAGDFDTALGPVGDDEVEAGRKAIESYGCHGCHRIAGFEDAPRPASELASVGGFSGHATVDLPNFQLSESELEAIRAAVEEVDGSDEPALVAGRQLVARYNCRGCHLIEDRGQAIAATVGDPGMLPPNLRGEGSRVQTDWLVAYLRHPAAVRLRAWLTIRMPEFNLSEDEVSAAVAYFEALEAASPDHRKFASLPAAPFPPHRLALGREIFDQLSCGRCHPTDSAAISAATGSGLELISLAPPLDLASQRLRYEWISLWLEDPQRWLPGTRMPTFFSLSPAGGVRSPLADALESPLFAESKLRMMGHFTSEDELSAFLADGDAVTAAIRDYVWSLTEGGE